MGRVRQPYIITLFQMVQGERRTLTMKQGIHPDFKQATVTCSCGNVFTVGSVKETINVEFCNECHPFYTGRQKFASADGRVDRFNKKYNLK